MSLINEEDHSYPVELWEVNEKLIENPKPRNRQREFSPREPTPEYMKVPGWEMRRAKEDLEDKKQSLQDGILYFEDTIAKLAKRIPVNGTIQSPGFLNLFEEEQRNQVSQMLTDLSDIKAWLLSNLTQGPDVIQLRFSDEEKEDRAKLIARRQEEALRDHSPRDPTYGLMMEGDYTEKDLTYWKLRNHYFSRKSSQLYSHSQDIWGLYYESKRLRRDREKRDTNIVAQVDLPTKPQPVRSAAVNITSISPQNHPVVEIPKFAKLSRKSARIAEQLIPSKAPEPPTKRSKVSKSHKKSAKPPPQPSPPKISKSKRSSKSARTTDKRNLRSSTTPSRRSTRISKPPQRYTP